MRTTTTSAIADPSQTEPPVVERYAYSAYGKRMILSGDFTEMVASVFEWTASFQGRPVDSVTGLIDSRHRTLQPALGRWLQRDPMEYVDSLNLYEFVQSGPDTL